MNNLLSYTQKNDFNHFHTQRKTDFKLKKKLGLGLVLHS